MAIGQTNGAAHAALALGFPQPANAPGVRLNRWTVAAPVAACAVSRDGAHAAFALGDGSVRLVPLRQFEARKMSAAVLHQGSVTLLGPDRTTGGFLSAGDDSRVLAVDSDGFAAELADHCGPITALDSAPAPAPKGLRAVAHGGKILLFDHHRRVRVLCSPAGAIIDIALSPDGRLLAASHDRGLALWGLDDNDSAPKAFAYRGGLLGLAWCAGGGRLAAISRARGPVCWSRRNGTIRTRTPCLGAVRDLAWSADGAVLVGTGDDAILCWPTAGASNGARRSSSGRVPFQLAHRPGAVPTALACHPRHNLMAAGCDDGCVMLGDLDHARDLVIKHADGGAITALAWSPDGDFLIAGNDLGEALVLDFTSLTKCKRA